MPLIAAATIQAFLDVGQNGHTTAEQGRALEDLICYVLGQVPGVAITHRNELNVFDTEEIDVAIWNDGDPDGFFFLPNIVLIECKNWSNRVGSGELNWFDAKLRNRGLPFGILVTTLGNTGLAADLTAAHAIIAAALREGRRLIVITADELLTIGSTDALVRLIKLKMCDLAVKGTVG
jgi:hypothetical protein